MGDRHFGLLMTCMLMDLRIIKSYLVYLRRSGYAF